MVLDIQLSIRFGLRYCKYCAPCVRNHWTLLALRDSCSTLQGCAGIVGRGKKGLEQVQWKINVAS